MLLSSVQHIRLSFFFFHVHCCYVQSTPARSVWTPLCGISGWSLFCFILMDFLGLTPIAVSCNLRPPLCFTMWRACCASVQTTKSGLWELYSAVGLSQASVAKTSLHRFQPPLFNGYNLKLVALMGWLFPQTLHVRRLLVGQISLRGTGIAPYLSKRLSWYYLEF